MPSGWEVRARWEDLRRAGVRHLPGSACISSELRSRTILGSQAANLVEHEGFAVQSSADADVASRWSGTPYGTALAPWNTPRTQTGQGSPGRALGFMPHHP